MKIVKVIKSHKISYSNPIKVKAEDKVLLLEKEIDYLGWVWYQNLKTGKQGWVPESIIINKHENKAVVNKDYSAMELTAEKGEKLELISEESGWLFCKNLLGQIDWIPKK